ncbi:hypothetical protein GALMADRAFT_920803 [Galerina marginata CBS 339.88]|uniref:Uncharacterized protein n=1 Tax=Galerina marginata (strain CBS 339.88) TaxID=685588 RepID=A0A067SHI6_GALM3|nr:hypothetical protein GALMADRAFT_920803 [Galerina marginata CBS 339.88]
MALSRRGEILEQPGLLLIITRRAIDDDRTRTRGCQCGAARTPSCTAGGSFTRGRTYHRPVSLLKLPFCLIHPHISAYSHFNFAYSPAVGWPHFKRTVIPTASRPSSRAHSGKDDRDLGRDATCFSAPYRNPKIHPASGLAIGQNARYTYICAFGPSYPDILSFPQQEHIIPVILGAE